MQEITRSVESLLKENEELLFRLREVEETLHSIHSGEVDAIVVSHPDSERIYTLVSAETPYRVIVEQMNEGALTLSAEGVIVYCNHRFMDLISISPEKILGTYFSDFIIDEDKAKYNQLFKGGLQLKCDGEVRCETGNNQIIHLNLLLSPMPQDMLGEVCIMASDISKLKLVEHELTISNRTLEQRVMERTTSLTNTLEELKTSNEKLLYANEKALESDHLKTAFLANMSHEIRTPMNAILGFTELLKNQQLTPERQQNYIRLIEKGGVRLLNIINDLISISKIESGQSKVILKTCNIKEQVEYIYNLFEPEVRKKGMQIFIHPEMTEEDSIILSDREKIYAILSNLVKNAIKYSDEGSIEIGYHLTKEGERDMLKFVVKDTGIGIPSEKLDSVFNRFEQVESAHIRRSEGVGLGLSIVKGYVSLLGGNIWVESIIGKGSSFHVTLPYSRIEAEEKETENGNGNGLKSGVDKFFHKLKILIVEDDDSSAILQKAMIEKYSREILFAETGTDAVEIVRNNPDIDLILMDISLPMMPGDEATKKIREFNKEVIIIAQSAHVFEVDKENTFKAGCNDFIVKPLRRSLLNELLVKYFLPKS